MLFFATVADYSWFFCILILNRCGLLKHFWAAWAQTVVFQAVFPRKVFLLLKPCLFVSSSLLKSSKNSMTLPLDFDPLYQYRFEHFLNIIFGVIATPIQHTVGFEPMTSWLWVRESSAQATNHGFSLLHFTFRSSKFFLKFQICRIEKH